MTIIKDLLSQSENLNEGECLMEQDYRKERDSLGEKVVILSQRRKYLS